MNKSNYQTEVDAFYSNFGRFTDKRIVIYGIGRKTATLVPELSDFHVVALMDRDADNVGKVMYGLRIVSLDEAEKIADLIIINAPSNYWNIIYKRIADSKLPIYFTDGTKAEQSYAGGEFENDSYWLNTMEGLFEKIEKAAIISFDLFDTLIMRKTYVPEMVWMIVEKNINLKWGRETNFVEQRKKAIVDSNSDMLDIYDIYRNLKRIAGLSEIETQELLNMELDTEEKVLIPRIQLVSVLKKAQEYGKPIYIISDMHLPKDFLLRILKKFGIIIPNERLWISSEKKASKKSGTIWKMFLSEEVCKKSVLHIGDNYEDDVEKPMKYGIDTYHVKASQDLQNHSFYSNISAKACSKYAAAVTGLINSHLFNDPFCLSDKRGNLEWTDSYTLGYVLFGPVLFTFLMWIEQQAELDGRDELVFMARDGYFLDKDYDFLKKLRKGKGLRHSYLEISRRAVMVPSIISESDIKDVIEFPYNGTFANFMEDRFCITPDERTGEENDVFISTVNDFEQVYNLCCRYHKEIINEVEMERKNYLEYFMSREIADNAVYVDLFFYGNAQYYLSKLLDKKLSGYYMACDLTENNRCAVQNEMKACFQKSNDKMAKKCNILQKCLFLESFLTAPAGMLIKVKGGTTGVYAKSGKNQDYFITREKINEGVKNYMKDYLAIYSDDIKLDIPFVDFMYGEMMGNHFLLCDELKNQFYFDNALIQRREMKIYE